MTATAHLATNNYLTLNDTRFLSNHFHTDKPVVDENCIVRRNIISQSGIVDAYGI